MTGSISAAESDRVLATVLFTDIVGSTARAEQLGDQRWHNLLGAHHTTGAAGDSRGRGGKVVKSLGDGFLAHLRRPGARRALRLGHCRGGSARSAFKSAAASMPARSSSPTATCRASPSTSPRASRRSPSPARCWSREPSGIWSPGRASASASEADTRSRACRNRWTSTRHNLLDAHHTTVRRQLTRYRGNEVKSMGDGFLATFDGPARAVRCACAIAEAVRPLDIQVRSGLHTGEIELADNDVQGIAVHIASRISALAATRRGAGITNRQGSGRRVGSSFQRARQDIPSRVSRNRWTSTRLRIDARSNDHPYWGPETPPRPASGHLERCGALTACPLLLRSLPICCVRATDERGHKQTSQIAPHPVALQAPRSPR